MTADLPGLTLRESAAPFTSLTGGHHGGNVKSWPVLRYAASRIGGRLSTVSGRILIHDTDRTLLSIKDGANADEIRESDVSIYLMTTESESSDWTTLFVGKLAKLSFPEPFVAALDVRVDDQKIQRIRSDAWKLTRQSWPNCKAEVLDEFAPILYGEHDASSLQTGPGMVPTLYVDNILYRYLVCAGKAKTITRAYVNGTQVSGSTWTTEYLTRNGRIYTVIKFSSTDAATADGADVTVDALGYETVGDGSGSVITNPALQLAHLLTNWYLGDYMTGSWISTNALIDSTALSAAEDYMDALAATGSWRSSDATTGQDVLSTWCTSWRMRCGWTYSGKIWVANDDIFSAMYGGTEWVWSRDEVAPPAFEEDDWSVTSRYTVKQSYSHAESKYLSTFSVVDAGVVSDTPGELSLEWSEST
jgi:hypothetical protein